MGFLNSLMRRGRPSKEDLVRSLAKQRVREDPMASAFACDESTINSLSVEELAGLPEYTIATIVESYAMMKRSGLPDPLIFRPIEEHRSVIGSGKLPSIMDLGYYADYRIEIEHGHAQIPKEFVAMSVHACCHHFGCETCKAIFG